MSDIKRKLEAARRLQGASGNGAPIPTVSSAKPTTQPQKTDGRAGIDAIRNATRVEDIIGQMLVDNDNMRQMWLKGMVGVHLVFMCGCVYLFVSLVSSPTNATALQQAFDDFIIPFSSFIPSDVYKRIDIFNLLLPLALISLASAMACIGLMWRKATLTYFAILPTAVMLLQSLSVCYTHDLWTEWKLIWLPIAFPMCLCAQIMLEQMFAGTRNDIIQLGRKHANIGQDELDMRLQPRQQNNTQVERRK